MIDHTSDFTTNEPSHIHIPRPSRVARAHAVGKTDRPDAPVQEHTAYRDVVRPFALKELESAGSAA